MDTGTAPRRAVDAATIAEAFRITAARRAGEIAVRTKDDDPALTWAQLRERADALAGGLHGLGVARGDTVALMLANRPEFHIADLAAMQAGGTPFSIYQTYTAEQIAYVVGDSGARIVVAERQYLPAVLEARRSLPALEHVILVDPDDGAPAAPGVLRLDEVEGAQPGFDVEASVAALTADDVLTLIYTSGTTGPPKGVELTHANIFAAMRSVRATIPLAEGARVISWLPAAHIAERAAHHYLPILYGLQVTCCPVAREVVLYLPAVRPQWFFAVPRIWEKLKTGIEAMVAGQPEEQRAASRAALDAGLRKVRLEQRGEPIPDDLASAVAAADAGMFAGLRAMFGLDQARAIHVAAAPTPVEVLEFFHAIGLPLAELWGMSETTATGACNPPDRVRIGTVGPPGEGVEIRLADDGEILVRGGIVMRGYRNRPDQTAEAIDADGWLQTGDVGAFDDEGYLRIVDRKKELIISSGGKNMAPALIEATLKSSSPLIAQVAVIGDRRPYNTALIVLDSDFAPAWAGMQGIDAAGGLAALAGDERVRAAVAEAVEAANAKLARVEQVKRFTIVAGDWLPGGDELTPTMKLRRRPIGEKYAAEIESMYA